MTLVTSIDPNDVRVESHQAIRIEDKAVDVGGRRYRTYISNLERLGILRISDDPVANIEGFREYGLLHDAIKSEFPGRHPKILNGSIQVTPLGRQFLITCVCARAR